MSLQICTATSEKDLQEILDLQKRNHSASLTQEQILKDGFVTVQHSLDLLTQMNDAAPQVVAKDDGRLIGYALVMLKSFQEMIPVLKPMFERLSLIDYECAPITSHPFYVMGQICVDVKYRGKGIFDGLYQKHRELYSGRYRLCVTFVSVRNVRSVRAHERVGFKVVYNFRDAIDTWNILVWDFSTAHP